MRWGGIIAKLRSALSREEIRDEPPYDIAHWDCFPRLIAPAIHISGDGFGLDDHLTDSHATEIRRD